MFDNEDHLRITKVQTTDGQNPVYDDQQRPVKKIIHLPLTAKKLIEEHNMLLPHQLKMKVEIIKAYTPASIPQVPDTRMADLEKENAELRAQLAKPKKPMGRPKKIKENETV